MTGIYIHIPFCRKKCRYCDFPSYGGMERMIPAYTSALCREIENSEFTGPADTIYFGGGTPSLLGVTQVKQILTAIRHHISITADAEITFEANPDSICLDYLQELHRNGINRLSIGIQSFQPVLLKRLGRIHTAEQAIQSIEMAVSAGIGNISADLMYGLPGQTLSNLEADLTQLFQLPVQHASVYSLIVEPGTGFYHDQQRGRLPLPSESELEHMTRLVHRAFSARGFEHYEISSYARPGYRSRHNCKYWQYQPYIGFGASAHSFYHNVRSANLANIPNYIQKAGWTSVTDQAIAIDHKRGPEDFCFLALRMRDGIDYTAFQQQFGYPLQKDFGPVIERLKKQKLIEETEHGCHLTRYGLEYGNYVFSQFIR